jgi:hypothetical protein
MGKMPPIDLDFLLPNSSNPSAAKSTNQGTLTGDNYMPANTEFDRIDVIQAEDESDEEELIDDDDDDDDDDDVEYEDDDDDDDEEEVSAVTNINEYGQPLGADGEIDMDKSLEWHFNTVDAAVERMRRK